MWILYYLWQCRKSVINNTRTCWVFWSWEEKGQSRCTANYCRNKNAYVGVAKGLQKLTVAESIKSAEQRREELATVKPAEEQEECESGAALLSCCGCAELCARVGTSQQGTLGTSQHRSGRSHQSAGWQWAFGDGDHKIQMLRRAGVSLNLNLPTSDESWNGIDLGQRLELRCFSWGIQTFFTPVENFASEEERMTCSLNFTRAPSQDFHSTRWGEEKKISLKKGRRTGEGHKTGWRH